MPTNLLQESFGISKSELSTTNISASDVKSGITFMNPNGEIQTGTLTLSGNATTGTVQSGKTFYSNSFTKQTGTLALSGNAAVSDVMSGKTFYSNNFTKKTGTLTINNKIQILIIEQKPIGNERREGDATATASGTIKSIPTTYYNAYNSDENYIRITNYSGSTINYHWYTHNIGIRAYVTIILA